jgi:hypothetical protein
MTNGQLTVMVRVLDENKGGSCACGNHSGNDTSMKHISNTNIVKQTTDASRNVAYVLITLAASSSLFD